MPRVPVDLGGPNVELQPAASPTSVLAPTGASPLRGIAEGLAKFDQGLQSFLEQKTAKQKEEDILKGEASVYEGNDAAVAEGVRTGKFPAQYSPDFIKGAKQATGSVRGGQLAAQFDAAYAGWDGKDSEDPKAFDNFFQGWLKDNLGDEQDPAILAGLLPHVRALQQNATAGYIADRDKAVRTQSLNAHVAEASQAVDMGHDQGKGNPEGTNYPVVFEAIGHAREAYLKTGGTAADFDKTMTDAISNKVLALKDEGLLKWFDEKIPGTDYSYGDTAYGAAVKQNTLEALDVVKRRAESDAAQKHTAEDKAAKDAAEAGAIDVILKDPNAPVPEDILAAGTKVDGTFKVRVLGWQEAARNSHGASDPEKVKRLYDDILGGGGTDAIKKAMDNGVLNGASDISAAFAFQKSVQETAVKNEDALKSPVFTSVQTAIKERTKDTTLANPVDGMTNEGFEADFDYRRKVQEWIAKNPNATAMDRDEAIGKIGKSILDNITQKDITGEGGVYNRPSDLTTPNPYSDGTTGPAKTGAPVDPAKADATTKPTDPAAASAAAAGLGADVGAMVGKAPPPLSLEDEKDIKDFKAGLDDTQTKAIAEQAAKLKVTPDEVIKNMLGIGKPTDPTTTQSIPHADNSVASQISYTPGKEPGFTQATADAIITKALEQAPMGGDVGSQGGTGEGVDPGARSILHLVGVHESNGNYNATFGNANSTVDLSKFTVNQIIARQLYNTRVLGMPSSAVGKYQFIRKTLTNLRDQFGAGNEKFTPELQDKFGMALLNGRGYQEFRAGKISQRQFALRLSQEWASLPDPRTGRSYYAGDGLNAAGTSPQRVYAALGMTSDAPVVQPASFSPDASQGGPVATPATTDVYANVPEAERPQFQKWNPDPIGNSEKNLSSVNPKLSDVIRRAQGYTGGVHFVVGMGKRTEAQQAEAVKMGWSKTMKSDHLTGSAVDLWPIVDGKVKFDPAAQKQIVAAMKRAAKEMGVKLDVGAEWKRFKDTPHFAIKGETT